MAQTPAWPGNHRHGPDVLNAPYMTKYVDRCYDCATIKAKEKKELDRVGLGRR